VRCHSASLHTEADLGARHAANYLKHWHASGTGIADRSDKTLSLLAAAAAARSASSCRVFIAGTTVAARHSSLLPLAGKTVYVTGRID